MTLIVVLGIGAQIRNTALTEKFSFKDFRARYGPDAQPLFLVGENGRVTIATVGQELAPRAGQTLISLVPHAEASAGGRVDQSVDDTDSPGGERSQSA